tara:strand:+ start:1391 stop:1603 length:213 start_codon:yes stop_codon:yes gene_type:complete
MVIPMERLLFRRFLLILMIGPLALGVIVMRTLMLIVTLSLASLATAEGRAPTSEEMQELDIVEQSWIFQG